MLIQPVGPAKVRLHIGPRSATGARESSIENGDDLIQLRSDGCTLVLTFFHVHAVVFDPQHGGLKLLIERRTIEGISLQNVGVALYGSLIISLAGLRLCDGHLRIELRVVAEVALDIAEESCHRPDEREHGRDTANPRQEYRPGSFYAGFGLLRIVGHRLCQRGSTRPNAIMPRAVMLGRKK